MTIRSAYEAAGPVWGSGPSIVYGALAEPLLDSAGDVTGKRALDVGTGAGVVAGGLVARGARVVACDLAHSMLAQGAATRPPAVVGDVLALPFRSGCFDLATAAFVLNHLADPVPGLRELGRVCRAGGEVLATTFEGEPTHPAKTVVDGVAERFGFVPPAWYLALRREVAPLLAYAPALAQVATEAGLAGAEVEVVGVRPPALTAADLVDWRLGMAHLAGFVGALGIDAREALRAEAIACLTEGVAPLVLPVLVLRARRAGGR